MAYDKLRFRVNMQDRRKFKYSDMTLLSQERHLSFSYACTQKEKVRY